MAISGATWRKHPFKIGETYIASQSFLGCPFVGFPDLEFVKGHAYQLLHIGHSHYDEYTIFTFRESAGTQRIDWWWSDDEPEALCWNRFQFPESSAS
jgi:hypothetical protein